MYDEFLKYISMNFQLEYNQEGLSPIKIDENISLYQVKEINLLKYQVYKMSNQSY